MKIMKFGGSSVANSKNMLQAAEIINKSSAETPCVVILSAISGVTDALIEIGRCAERGDESFRNKIEKLEKRHFEITCELVAADGVQKAFSPVGGGFDELKRISEGVYLLRELTLKTLDRILSFGELSSSCVFSAALNERGLKNVWKDARELIRTDSTFGFGEVDFDITNKKVSDFFKSSNSDLWIVPGFIASDTKSATTTLGRGGSDYTASIIAHALDADVLEIWTDVSGLMTADPRIVRNIREISTITYQEAMELSHFGAKVIYPPTIQPVLIKNIPIIIKNTFSPDERGTLVQAENSNTEETIRGISSIANISILNLEGSGMIGVAGIARRVFSALSQAKISVVLITQSSSEHSICIAVEDKYTEMAKVAIDSEFEHEVNTGKIEPLRGEDGFSILALVGDNMRHHPGISGKMFSALGNNGINIHAIAQGASERNISAIIKSTDEKKAVNTLHEEFFSDGKKQVNLFIMGIGTVGKKLLEQVRQQTEYLSDNLRLNVRVVGLGNSRKMLFDDEGIDLSLAEMLLSESGDMNLEEFTSTVIDKNLRNSVFVDVTANKDVVAIYPKLLSKSISVIACNKIAASSSYEEYEHLKDLSRGFNAAFLFETNVGAGLPVINTVNDLMRSGDKITGIEAVLSGTLNFVFNNYDTSGSFASIVRQAQDEGYTEPDPRLDLSGMDVARKILILAREAGYPMEMQDIDVEGFLPESCLDGEVDDFYIEMEKQEDYFADMYNKAENEGLSLKYLASFRAGKIKVGLQSIEPSHDFAGLSGKDNAVLLHTNRYVEQPLVIKGAGAGADVTAAGVFADIIKVSTV